MAYIVMANIVAALGDRGAPRGPPARNPEPDVHMDRDGDGGSCGEADDDDDAFDGIVVATARSQNSLLCSVPLTDP